MTSSVVAFVLSMYALDSMPARLRIALMSVIAGVKSLSSSAKDSARMSIIWVKCSNGTLKLLYRVFKAQFSAVLYLYQLARRSSLNPTPRPPIG